jgi:hypothetical protein
MQLDTTEYGTDHAEFSDGNAKSDNFRQGTTTFFQILSRSSFINHTTI